jgi:hypothetical protein
VLLLLPGVLEDEHYDHGDDGEETYEHLGPILVRHTKPAYLLLTASVGPVPDKHVLLYLVAVKQGLGCNSRTFCLLSRGRSDAYSLASA